MTPAHHHSNPGVTKHTKAHDVAMEQNIAELNRKIDRITEALLGNEFNKEGGIVSIVNDHEKRITHFEEHNVSTHEKRIKDLENNDITQKMVIGILKIIAVAIVTGVIGNILYLIFKH